jgi:hypothetical protein
MNQEIKLKWLEALRSGQYKQTKYSLKNEKGFCCLGVLCDIYSQENKTPWEKHEEEREAIIHNTKVLPVPIMRWAELKDSDPYLRYDPEQADTCALSHMNDAKKLFL